MIAVCRFAGQAGQVPSAGRLVKCHPKGGWSSAVCRIAGQAGGVPSERRLECCLQVSRTGYLSAFRREAGYTYMIPYWYLLSNSC